MRRPIGDVAAVLFLATLLQIAIIFIVAILAGTNRNLVEDRAHQDKTNRAYCDAKVRALAHLPPPDRGSEKGKKEQQELDTLCASLRSAEAAEDAADYALGGLVFVILATFAASAAAVFTRQQADIARQSFIASNRAWIKVLDIRLSPNGTLRFKADGIEIGIIIEMQNIGSAPAIHVSPHLSIVPYHGEVAVSHHLRFCATSRDYPPGSGMTVFPGDKAPPKENIEKYSFPARIAQSEIDAASFLMDGATRVRLSLIGRIDYKFGSDDGTIHQTSIMREIVYHGEGGTLRDSFIVGSNVSNIFIRLKPPSAAGGAHAN